MADYASQLLGGSPESRTDYAGKLIGPTVSGMPTQEVRSRSDMAASAGAQAGASFIDDPRVKMEFFARRRFPNDPAALERYGINTSGQVYYKADDGNLYLETPEDYSIGSIGKRLAATAGDVVSAGPGMVTGVVTAPMFLAGPAGAGTSMALTGAAGVAGETARQLVGRALGDPIDPMKIAGTGAMDAASQGFGGAVGKFLERNAARDIGRLNQQNIAAIERKAAAEGVELTPAEKTNLPSLKGQQTLLSEMDGSSNVMDEFYKRRAGQVDAAVDRFLTKISVEDSVELAGRNAKGAAFQAMEALAKQRAQAAGPLYQQAFSQTVGMNPAALPMAQAIMARIPKDVIARAQNIARIEGIDLGDPKNSLKGMHYLKLALDRKLNAGPWEGVVGAEKNALVGLKNDLVTALDEMSAKDAAGRSLYKQAREIYAHSSPMIDSVREGLTGIIAGLKDDKARDAIKMLMDPARTGPLAMSKAKRLIQQADPSAWQDVKRAFLQDAWESASIRFATSSPYSKGAKFEAAIRGNPKQWKMLQEALEPGEIQALNNLMDVLEATGRGLPRNSLTVPKGQTLKAMEREAGGLTGMAASAVDAPGRALQGRLGEWIQEARLGKHAEKIAKIITNPMAMQQLKQLKRLSPKDSRYIAGVSQLLGVEVGGVLEPATDEIAPTR